MSENKENPVTVAEMIAALKKLDPNARLFTTGYEGGYEDATLPEGEPRKFSLNVNDAWYYGPHENLEDDHAGKFSVAIGYCL